MILNEKVWAASLGRPVRVRTNLYVIEYDRKGSSYYRPFGADDFPQPLNIRGIKFEDPE